MKILLTGCKGQVGSEVLRLARLAHIEVVATDHHDLDITGSVAVMTAVATHQPTIVINAAAHTAVDKAESEPDAAFAINAAGPGYLAQACAQAKIPLLHISTDYVFAGDGTVPYLETDAISPLGVYGQSKYDGEQAVRDLLSEHVIVRTSWVFGSHGHNFVKTMLRLGLEKETLSVVDDQLGCPTYATDIALVLLNVSHAIEAGHAQWGTYHFCGAPQASWHGFATAIFEEARKHTALKVKTVQPVSSDQFPTPAKRPSYSVLGCAKISRDYDIAPSDWRAALTECVPLILKDL
jgi:dTDP-4-dehydrorhamnose reductase